MKSNLSKMYVQRGATSLSYVDGKVFTLIPGGGFGSPTIGLPTGAESGLTVTADIDKKTTGSVGCKPSLRFPHDCWVTYSTLTAPDSVFYPYNSDSPVGRVRRQP